MKKLVPEGHNVARVVALDIEKTRPGSGRDPEAFTIEVGMARLGMCQHDWGGALSITDHLSTLIRPPVPVNNFDDHHISDDDLSDAPSLLQAAPAILKFLEGASFVVAHNFAAECRLFEELADLGYSSDIRFADTMRMSRIVAEHCFERNFKSHKLAAVSDRLRCPPLEPHRALDDAIACANVYAVFRFFLKYGFDYGGWKGFRRLEKDVGKQFIYSRTFDAGAKRQKKTTRSVPLKCRIPASELALLRNLYWGDE